MAASQSLPCFHFLMEDKLTSVGGGAGAEVKNIICSTQLVLSNCNWSPLNCVLRCNTVQENCSALHCNCIVRLYCSAV